ncbi:OB-fold-containig protein [Gymnodinialimonas sp. 2305UL16-5]|uniref:OB-fold-containig protein n=1 Tax=Gymnodinialimonas mytili TaxID=3126503 RepID=UPI0030B55563
MLDTLMSGPYVPFAFSIALLLGLLALELALLAVGGSLIGDGPDTEIDIDLPGGPDMDFDLEVDFDGLDVDATEFELELGEDVAVQTPGTAPTGPTSWLGLGKMPMLIWLATLLAAFGISGVGLQALAVQVFGNPLPASLAIVPCGIGALWFTGRFGAVFARVLPKTETQAVSTRTLNRRRGTITQGTAKRGMPAEVRVTDRYGNIHYLRAEPMQDGAEIPQGADVLVLRHRPTGGFRLIAL